MSNAEEGVQVEQEKVAVIGKGKGKAKGTGDLILDVAQSVEGLPKTTALKLARDLADTIETEYLRLGGVLKVIYENGWFEGHESFDAYVFNEFGFQSRKAKYLIEIYTELVTKMIPWEKVAGLGWTKLKDLAKHLTLDNVDEWVAKATPVTVAELQAMLKAGSGEEGGGEASQTTQVTKLTYKVKPDQLEVISTAVNKAKAELTTDYDEVAIENICAAYLAGGTAPVTVSLLDQMKTSTPEEVLKYFEQVWPDINISVEM